MAKVLISDGLLRKSLSAVRSLGRVGAEVTVAEKTKCNMSGLSKYCRRSLRYPDPIREPNRFSSWMTGRLTKGEWDVWFPMDDATMDLAIEHRELWGMNCRLVLPPSSSYRLFRDKLQATRMAEKVGLCCPKTDYVSSISEVSKLAKDLSFPVICKPRFGAGSRGIRKIHCREELLNVYREWPEGQSYPMIQECIPQGTKLDVCLLYDFNNKKVAHFIQKELRHFPLQTGPSTAQESIWDENLLQECEMLMKQVPWTGVLEIEFMVNGETGEAVFMEVNPRFWNSLECAVRSGIDFPSMLLSLAMNQEIIPVGVYQPGIVCRNLLPGDGLHFIANRNRRQLNPPLLAKKSRKVFDDVLDWKDPMPVAGFMLTCLRYVLSPKAWRDLIKRS